MGHHCHRGKKGDQHVYTWKRKRPQNTKKVPTTTTTTPKPPHPVADSPIYKMSFATNPHEWTDLFPKVVPYVETVGVRWCKEPMAEKEDAPKAPPTACGKEKRKRADVESKVRPTKKKKRAEEKKKKKKPNRDAPKDSSVHPGVDCCKLCGSRCACHKKPPKLKKTHKCNVCGKMFPRRGNMLQHERRHTEKKRYKCGVCGKQFPHKGNMEKHTRTHSAEKPFQCDICCKCFKLKQTLQRHGKTHRDGELPWNFSCEDCGQKFQTQAKVDQHRPVCDNGD